MTIMYILLFWATGFIATVLLDWNRVKREFEDDNESTLLNFMHIHQLMMIWAAVNIVLWPQQALYSITLRTKKIFKKNS